MKPNYLLFLYFLFLGSYTYSQTAFEDQSIALGVDVTLGETFLGNGVSFYDFDNDGWDDLTITSSHVDAVRFFKNINGTFVEQNFAGLLFNYETKSVTWVDYDNDGDNDLFVTSAVVGNKLLENLGSMTFQDITASSGISQSNLYTYGASWGDYNNDGFLDVFLSNRTEDVTNKLYENNGNGTFTDVTVQAGIDLIPSYSFCSAFLDINNDGFLDLYVSNDKFSFRNKLYKNNGDGAFIDISEFSGTDILIDAMSVTVGDYNSDGFFDIYVTNTPSGNFLLRNNGDETFTNTAGPSGTEFNSIGWGASFFDADNDTDLDLYVSGMLDGSDPNLLSAAFYENNNDGSFTLNNSCFPGDNRQSFSNAIGDLNNDGLMDVVVINNSDRIFLWKNVSLDPLNWVKIKLTGTQSNRNAVGAKIEISVNGQKQYRTTLCGEGYMAQSGANVHFGIGEKTDIDYIKINWPSGNEDAYFNVDANQTISFTEGDPEMIIGDVTIAEGAGSVSVPIRIDRPSTVDTVVEISTVDNSATNPNDYTTTVVTATIPAGPMFAEPFPYVTINIPITDDNTDELTENFTVNGTLTSGNTSNAINSGTVTIIDNDDPSCSDTAVWSVGVWDIAPLVPTSTTNVTIMSDYDTSVTGSIDACELNITNEAFVTIAPGDYIKVEGDIALFENATLTVAHAGNLVQVDDGAIVTNNGIINVQVDTPELNGFDFMLLGSPMSSETRDDVFSTALRVRNHLTGSFSPNTEVGAGSPGAGNWLDEEGDDWPVYSGGINLAEGYMILRDVNGPATALNLNFDTGTLNNGVTTYTAGYNESQNSSPNIIANPYASAISATDFINTNTGIVDAVYFWEHITPPNAGTPGPYGLDYTMEDLSIFNLTGGTAAAGSDPGISTIPNGIISTAQGFGVKVMSEGPSTVPITFNNAMRRTSGNTTLRNQDLDRVWLKVQSEGYDLKSTALIGFLDEATDGIDVGYDAKRLATNVSLYSHLDDGSNILGIQARGIFEEDEKIPMGFATLINEKLDYTISIQNIEGLNLVTATAYLIDTFKNVVTNLNESNYSFKSEKGIYNNRFILQFSSKVVLETNSYALESISIYPNPTQNIVTIASPQLALTSAKVFDIRGRVVSEIDFLNQTNYQVDVSYMENGIYFIDIITENSTIIKRILKE